MTVRTTSDLYTADTERQKAVAELTASVKATQIVQRLTSHRDRLHVEISQLRREQAEIEARRDLLRRHLDAVEAGFQVQLADIDAALDIYKSGVNSLGPR